MSPTLPLTQLIGRTERALFRLMDLVLAGTGGTFLQWVALNFTAVNGDSIERGQLVGRLANALQIDDTAAEAGITEMVTAAHRRALRTARRKHLNRGHQPEHARTALAAAFAWHDEAAGRSPSLARDSRSASIRRVQAEARVEVDLTARPLRVPLGTPA
jgi:hypothetical protein